MNAAAPKSTRLPDPSILDDVYVLERDPGVRALIRHGWTMGCFYIESPSMRSLFEKLRCETFEGAVAASSIIRPGVAESGMMQEYVARATGRCKTTYLHPAMEELLGDTYGVMVYQEDVLKVGHALGGLTLAEADSLRRAMSGKSRSKDAMERLQVKFFSSCRQRGLDDHLTGEIWRQIESFAAYSFCKGHSAAFAVLSFQMAWLKAHYPAEFLAGVIANGGGFYSTAAYVQEARRLGIRVEGPCVNRSRLDWWGETNRTPGGPEWWERKENGKRKMRNGKLKVENGKPKSEYNTFPIQNKPSKKKESMVDRGSASGHAGKRPDQQPGDGAGGRSHAERGRSRKSASSVDRSHPPPDARVPPPPPLDVRVRPRSSVPVREDPFSDPPARAPANHPQRTTINPQRSTNIPPTGVIRAGLLAVAGLSPELVTRVLDERNTGGLYRTAEDFWSRTRPAPDEAERLILCGAMDVFGLPEHPANGNGNDPSGDCGEGCAAGAIRARLMIRHALWQRAQVHDSPLAPWDGSLPEWARDRGPQKVAG